MLLISAYLHANIIKVGKHSHSYDRCYCAFEHLNVCLVMSIFHERTLHYSVITMCQSMSSLVEFVSGVSVWKLSLSEWHLALILATLLILIGC